HRPYLEAWYVLETARGRSCRAELERVGERKQHPRGTARIIGCAIAQRNGNAEIDLPVVEQEQAHTAAGRSQRKTLVYIEAGIPSRAGIEEAIELEAAPILIVQFMVEAQFE